MGLNEAAAVIDIIRQAVQQETKSGAKIDYKLGQVASTSGYIASAYLDGNYEEASEDFRVPAGWHVSPGDYVVVGIDYGGNLGRWINEILPFSLYAKIAINPNTGEVYESDGTSTPTPGGGLGGGGGGGVERYVAPDGSNSNPGTIGAPWATIQYAMQQAQPGMRIWLREGEYSERFSITPPAGTVNDPITIGSYTNERAVLHGWLSVHLPQHWKFERFHIRWDDSFVDSDRHMWGMRGGNGWTLNDCEIWGARSWANLLVTHSSGSHPTNWAVKNCVIHDCIGGGGVTQSHNIYINTEAGAGGLVERNIFYNARGGSNIKIGYGSDSSPTEGGAKNVTVRYNTAYNTASTNSVGLSGYTLENILLERNLIVRSTNTSTAAIRIYQVGVASNVVVKENVGFDFDVWGSDFNGGGVLTTTQTLDGNLNRWPVNPSFNAVPPTADDAASGGVVYQNRSAYLVPQNPKVAHVGHLGSGSVPVASEVTVLDDDFDRTIAIGSGWGTASPTGGAWSHSSNVPFGVQSGHGVIDTVENNSRSASQDSISVRDVRARIPIKVVNSGSSDQRFRLQARRVDASNYYFTEIRFTPSGSVVLNLSRLVGGSSTSLRSNVTLSDTWSSGDTWYVELICEGSGTTFVGTRAWRADRPEATVFHNFGEDTTSALQSAAALGVRFQVVSGWGAGANGRTEHDWARAWEITAESGGGEPSGEHDHAFSEITGTLNDTQHGTRGSGLHSDSHAQDHASRHGTGGADAVSPAAIGAATDAALTAHVAAGHAFVGVRATQAAAQSLANNTLTNIEFGAEAYDTNDFHDTVTNNNRLTIPTGLGGVYIVTAGFEIAANTTGRRFGTLVVNGSGTGIEGVNQPTVSVGNWQGTISAVLQLAAGDWVGLRLQQNSGNPLNASNCTLTAVKIG